MTQPYEILVCPVCGEQNYEEFGWEAESPNHFHEEWGEVEPVRVKVELPPEFNGLRDLALYRLQEQKREQAFKLAERRIWEALPQEEKDRREAERRSKLSPMALAMEDMIRESARDSLLSLNRQAFSWTQPVDISTERKEKQ